MDRKTASAGGVMAAGGGRDGQYKMAWREKA
jgi:hypothetical protein